MVFPHLLHLKGSGDSFQENRCPDSANRHTQVLLCGDKDVVPESCLEVSLKLWNVVVRAGAVSDELVDVVVKVQSEIEEGARCNLSIDSDVSLVKMPTARTDEEDGRLLLGRVDLAVLGIGVGNSSPNRVAEVALTLGEVGPSGAGRIFKVCHVDVSTRI